MTLFEKIGQPRLSLLDKLNRKKQLIAIHSEPTGARIVLASSETILVEGLDKDETTRLFKYLEFIGQGVDGFDTPAFPPHLKQV